MDETILLENSAMKSLFLQINRHLFALRFATNVAWPLKCAFFFCCLGFERVVVCLFVF